MEQLNELKDFLLNRGTVCSIWEKGDLVRLYVKGYRDKPLSTKKTKVNAYYALKEDGIFPTVFVECPTQSGTWCRNYANQVKEGLIVDYTLFLESKVK